MDFHKNYDFLGSFNSFLKSLNKSVDRHIQLINPSKCYLNIAEISILWYLMIFPVPPTLSPLKATDNL